MPKPKPLATRVALVTGAGSGIGKAIAHRLAAEGACVVVADIDAEQRRGRRRASSAGRTSPISVVADVTDEAQVVAAFRTAVLAFGGVDLVVNNAGLSISKPLLETTVADWDLQHDVMARGSFLVSREAARIMHRAGRWAATSSTSSARTRSSPARTTSPTGRRRPTRPTRSGCSPPSSAQFGIRVNGVNPDGVVRGSGIFAKGWGADRARTYGIPEDKLGEFYAQRTLLKREVLPEHVAAAVFALAGGDLSQTTGPAHPGRRGCRGGVPAVSRAVVERHRRRRRPRRVERAGRWSGRVGPRRRSSSTEVHRFPNEPVALPDGLHWDIAAL